MTKKYHIVGAGLAGLTTAVALARRGFEVAIYDDPCNPFGATKAAHGISTIKGMLESQSKLFDLKMLGHIKFDSYLKQLEELLKVNRPTNVWHVGVTEKFRTFKDYQSDFKRIYRREFSGAHRVKIETKNSNCFAECYYPGDWWIEPDYLTDILNKVCQKFKVHRESMDIKEILKNKNGQGFKLKTPDGYIFCDHLIICAGVHTKELISNLEFEVGDIFAVAGYTFKTQVDLDDLCAVRGKNGITIKDKNAYIGSTSDKVVLKTKTHLNDPPQSSPNAIFCDLIQNIFGANATEVLKFKDQLVAKWGIRVRTKNREPFFKTISKNATSSLTVNFGYYKSGIILSWLFAENFVEELVNGESSVTVVESP